MHAPRHATVPCWSTSALERARQRWRRCPAAAARRRVLERARARRQRGQQPAAAVRMCVRVRVGGHVRVCVCGVRVGPRTAGVHGVPLPLLSYLGWPRIVRREAKRSGTAVTTQTNPATSVCLPECGAGHGFGQRTCIRRQHCRHTRTPHTPRTAHAVGDGRAVATGRRGCTAYPRLNHQSCDPVLASGCLPMVSPRLP